MDVPLQFFKPCPLSIRVVRVLIFNIEPSIKTFGLEYYVESIQLKSLLPVSSKTTLFSLRPVCIPVKHVKTYQESLLPNPKCAFYSYILIFQVCLHIF